MIPGNIFIKGQDTEILSSGAGKNPLILRVIQTVLETISDRY